MSAQKLLVWVLVCACAAVHAGYIQELKEDLKDTAEEAWLQARCQMQNDTDACFQLFMRQYSTELIVTGAFVAAVIIGLCIWCCSCCRSNRGRVYHHSYPATR